MSQRKRYSIQNPPPGPLNAILTDIKRAIDAMAASNVSGDDLIRAGLLRRTLSGGLEPASEIVGGSAEASYGTPPAPIDLVVTPGYSFIMIEFGGASYPGHSHAQILRSLTNDLSTAVVVGQTTFPPYADTVGVGSPTYHYWVRFVNKANPPQTGPANDLLGTPASTAPDVGALLDLLTGQITASQLAASLATPISQIPGISSDLAQEAIDRANGDAAEALARSNALAMEASNRAAALAQESSDRAAAILAASTAQSDALATEIGNRVSAINAVDTAIRADLATADAAVVTSLTSAFQTADAATLASAQGYTFSKTEINSAIAAMGTQLTADFQAADATTLASAQTFTYSRAAIDAADAAALSTLRAEFAAADSATLASAQNYTYAKATIDSAIATSASTLRAQITGGSTATDLNVLTSGLLYQMRETSAAADNALSQQITLLSAGAGEQFDYSNIWYYDSGSEGWYTSGSGSTLSAVNGWLRLVSNSGTLTDRYFLSPDSINVNGSKYPQVRLRVRKVGSPAWEGTIYFNTTTDATFNVAKSLTVAEPTYDANGIGLVTFNMPAGWTGATIRQIRFDASTSITPTDYYELDWVAVGRPSPGASSAQLTALQSAMVTADDAMAQDITALEADLTTLTGDVATKASASALSALDARVTSAEGVNSSQSTSITNLNNSLTTTNNTVATKADASALSSLDTRVTTAEGTVTSHGTRLNTLESTVNNPTTGVAATASALDVVETLVNHATTGVTATATKAALLESKLSNQRDIFTETWDSADPLARWQNYSGAGGSSIVSASDTVGGKAMRVGDNAGDDQAWLVHQELIPFDPNKLYRMRVKVRRPNGDGAVYIGWAGMAADGVTQVNASGAASVFGNHYHCISAGSPGTGWTEFSGYTKGYGATAGTTATGTLAAPGKMHPNVRYLRAMVLVNYASKTGITEVGPLSVDDAEIKEVESGLNTAVATKADASALATTNTNVTNLSGTVTALSTDYNALKASVENPTTGLTSKASVTYVDQAEADAVSAAAAYTQTLETRLNRVVNYMIRSSGSSATGLPWVSGIYTESGVLVNGGARSYCLVVLNGSTGAVISSQNYDVYGLGETQSGRDAAALASALNALTSDKVVVVFTRDEPNGSRLTGGLEAAMYRCGASRAVFGAAAFQYRSAYILVGMPGIGEGGGVERYAGAVSADPNAFCEYNLQLINGRPAGLGGNALNAAIQVEAATRATQTGELYAQYTVKTDVGGLVSGYGLASTATNATPTSAFGVQAGQFFVGPPAVAQATAPTANLYKGFVWRDTANGATRYWTGSAWSTTPQTLPFVVQAVPTTVNGVAVPAGMYAESAFIMNGTITNAKIANLAVDDAKIANLSVAKLTAGSIAVGQYAQSTGYVAGSAGWRINGDGTAEFSGVVVRGTIFASQGEVGGWTIGSNYLQSTTYALGTSGTRFNSDGTGQIGGLQIGATYIQSQNYASGTAGWRLSADGTGQIIASQIYSANWSAIQGAGKPADNANYSVVSSGDGGSADLMLGVDLGNYQIKPLRAGFGTVVASYEDDGYSTVAINSTASEYDHVTLGAGVSLGFSTTTFADVQGMVLTVPDGLAGTPAVIEISGVLVVDAGATTTGIGLQIVSEDVVVGDFLTPLTGTTVGRHALGGLSSSLANTANNIVRFTGLAVLGAHSTFKLQAKSEVAGSAITIKPGSYMTVRAMRNVVSAVANSIVTPNILTPLSNSVTVGGGATATSSGTISFTHDGTFKELSKTTVARSGSYLSNTVSGAGAQYEIRYTRVSGNGSYSAPSGWNTLSSERKATLTVTATTMGVDSSLTNTASSVIRVELRPLGSATTTFSSDITVNLSATSFMNGGGQ